MSSAEILPSMQSVKLHKKVAACIAADKSGYPKK